MIDPLSVLGIALIQGIIQNAETATTNRDVCKRLAECVQQGQHLIETRLNRSKLRDSPQLTAYRDAPPHLHDIIVKISTFVARIYKENAFKKMNRARVEDLVQAHETSLHTMVAYFVADISDMVVNLADKLAGQFGWNADPELQRVIEMSRREYELELERAETLEATRIQQGMQSGQEPVQSDTFTDEQMFQMVLEMSIVTEEAERLKRERDEMESKLKLKRPVTSYRVPVRTLQQEVDALKLEISQLEGRMDALQMRASKLAVQPDKEDEIDQVMVELSTLSYECENRVDELEQLERQLHRPSVSRSSSIMDAEVIPVRPLVRSDTELRIDELDSRERALRIQEQLFEQFKAQWTKPPPSPHRMTGASWNQV